MAKIANTSTSLAASSTLTMKIVSETYVKPSSPTPPSSKSYKLSSLDQDTADVLVSLAFFYPKQSFLGPKGTPELRQLLEASLSKTLIYYYPLAGRLTDNFCVHCSDEGVQLWEVQVQASMPEILDHNAKDFIFPPEQLLNNSGTGHLLTIQLNHFKCGAICIGITISHKLGDAQTICRFMNDWAAIARGSTETPFPLLDGASVFPPFALPFSERRVESRARNCARRRFVFSASNLSKLKAMVAEESRTENPSKVEVVTALIFKTAMAAASATSYSFRPSVLLQAANIRPITVPPLSENCVGNFVANFWISANEEKEANLPALVGKLRRSKLEFRNRYRKNLEGGEVRSQMSIDWEDLLKGTSNNSFDWYMFTSWCRFPIYKVDFGWGKPVSVCIPCASANNIIFLMDTQSGDGVEAFVALEEAEMSIFEHDEEFLAFAAPSPNTWERDIFAFE